MARFKKIEIILWERLKKGDLDALGSLYNKYIDELFAYGIQISTDKSYVMDCIHDLFFDLYKYKGKLASTDNVKYYLLKSLKRKIFKKNATKIISLSQTNEFPISTTDGIYSSSIEDEIIASEHVSEKTLQLTTALNFLSKKQRRALFLRYNEDKPYEEIALIMEVSVQTSRTIMYRAIKILRKRLATLLFICFSHFF